jgi:hypothetical protein
MQQLKPTDKAFLVLVDAGEKQFLTSIDGTTVYTTGVPSVCPRFDYATAEKLARELQRRRHPFACVSDSIGQPVTGSMLAIGDPPKPNNLPETLKELYQIPVSEQRRRYKSDPTFAKRVDELEAEHS